jgi:hypothetical protein
MRKTILTAVALIALASPALAQSAADIKTAADNFYAGMTNIANTLVEQRDTVCPKQKSGDQFSCRIQFGSAISLVSAVKVSQTIVELNAGNKDGFEKAKKDLNKAFDDLKAQLDLVSNWK